VELAIVRWRPDFAVLYAEGDVANLGGLNSKLTQSGADEVIKKLAGFYNDEFAKLDGDKMFLRKGGDEFGLTCVGISYENVHAAIDRAKQREVDYVRAAGLDQLMHTKMGRATGTGLIFFLVEYDGDPNTDLRRSAEAGIERLKIKGAENGR